MFTRNLKNYRKAALIMGLAISLGTTFSSQTIWASEVTSDSKTAHHSDTVNQSNTVHDSTTERVSNSTPPEKMIRQHAHHSGQHGFHKEFKGIDHWVKVFDDPKRDAWQRPEKVVSALSVEPNQVVADIGAGTGYFAFRIAQAHPTAKVYAADVEKEMVDYLAKTVKERAIPNVIPFQINPSTPDLPERIDLALVVDTYHHIDNRSNYFKQLGSRLTPNGRVAIIDFTMESPEGPPKKHRITKEEVVKELAAAGLRLDKEVNELPHQYFLIFRSHD